jgi:hypothetical protein
MAKFDRLCIVFEGMEDVGNMIPVTLYTNSLSLLALTHELERDRELEEDDQKPIPFCEYVQEAPAAVDVGLRVVQTLD